MSVVWVYNAQEAAQAVQDSLAAGTSFNLRGRATKSALGRPVAADRTLDLSRIAGAIRYEPEELILSARGPLGCALELSLAMGQLRAARGFQQPAEFLQKSCRLRLRTFRDQ